MINSSAKRNVSDSSNKRSVLSDLQKEKEKIFQEMKELEYRRKREKEQRQEKSFKPIPVIEKNLKEKSPPRKKFVKIEQKNFEEIMREAAEREKALTLDNSRINSQNKQKSSISDIQIKKRKLNDSCEYPLPSIKKKNTNNNVSDKSSEVPFKKPKLNDPKINSLPEKSKNLKPINSVVRTTSDIHVNTVINNRNNYNLSKAKSTISENSTVIGQNRGIAAQNSFRPTKSGITSQSKLGISSQNSIKSNRSDISNQTRYGITAQNNLKSSNTGILAQSSISSKNLLSKNDNNPRDSIVNQNVSKNLSSNRISSTPAKLVTSQNVNNLKPKTLPVSDKHLNRSKINYDKMEKSTTVSKGISAQNNRISQKDHHYSGNVPSKGIAAQNGGRGILAQSNIGHRVPQKTVYPPARGIAAQNGARGILAQSNMNYNSANSDDDEEDEYDSDLGSFIDDTEDVITDDIVKEIHKSLKYDPNKYSKVSKYDDCKNMESKYNEICKEEMRSARIARDEDNQELQEEERRLKKKGRLP